MQRFNGFVRNGRDEDFQRGDHIYSRWLGDTLDAASPTLGTVEKGPFHAIEVYPGDVSTFGGVLTDDSEEVAQQSTLLLAQSPRDLVDWCGRRSVDMVNSDPGVAVGVELGELSAGRVLELTLAGR